MSGRKRRATEARGELEKEGVKGGDNLQKEGRATERGGDKLQKEDGTRGDRLQKEGGE